MHVVVTSENKLALLVWNLNESAVYLEEVAFLESLLTSWSVKSAGSVTLSLIDVNFWRIVLTLPATEKYDLLSLWNLESSDVGNTLG